MTTQLNLRVGFPLGGTDLGRSGVGGYVREVFPRLRARLNGRGSEVVVFGTRRELEEYGAVIGNASRVVLPDEVDRPAVSALWHLGLTGLHARTCGIDVLLMPAANRRFVMQTAVPAVSVVHDLAQLHVPQKYDPLRMAYLRYGVIAGLRRSSVLVAVSEATRSDVASALGRSVDSIELVPNGVDVDRFTQRVEVMPSGAPRFLDLKPYLLYAARLELPGKNHLRLLRAFAASHLRNTHQLVFVGKDWGAKSVITDEIRRLGLDRSVSLLGFVEEDVLTGLFQHAAAVLMVGLWEGFGLPALEALACGRPVMASNTGALPEVVGPLGVLCDPQSETSMRSALERVSNDDELRQRCEHDGPVWARTFTWERTVDGLLAAIEKAAA